MSNNEIKEAIQQLAGTHLKDEVYIEVCEVTKVDEPSRTCTCKPVSGKATADIINVLLMAEVDDGILVIPSVGSTVIIGYTKRNPPFVMMFSQIDKVLFIAGESSLQIIDGTIQFNEGSLGGLTKTVALTQKLNNLENLVNDLIGKYNAHTHILTLTTGTGTAAPTATVEPDTLTPTERADIEDTTIIH